MKKYLIYYTFNGFFGLTEKAERIRYANDITHAYRIIMHELEQMNNAADEMCKFNEPINITYFSAEEIGYDANVRYENPIL